MAKCPAYYSTNPSDPDVWHDHDDCPAGIRIPDENKALGKPEGYRRCERCIERDDD